MKLPALLVLVSVPSLLSLPAPEPPAPAVGRFVLHSGTIAALNGPHAHEVKMVFKLDTATGETWKYFEIVKDGTLVRGWLKITDRRPAPEIPQPTP